MEVRLARAAQAALQAMKKNRNSSPFAHQTKGRLCFIDVIVTLTAEMFIFWKFWLKIEPTFISRASRMRAMVT